MKKRAIMVCTALLVLVILSGILYVNIGCNNMENRMWDYLKLENYSEADIKSIKVKHSFANVILSYNEWSVDVVYEDEPTSVYIYFLRDGNIELGGVSGTTDKENLKHID